MLGSLIKTRARVAVIALVLGYGLGDNFALDEVISLYEQLKEVKTVYDEMTAPASELINN